MASSEEMVPSAPSASRAIEASSPTEQTYFGKPYLTLIPNEILLLVADELERLLPQPKYFWKPRRANKHPQQQYPKTLANLCLVDKHLHGLFEHRLYRLSGLKGRPCAMTWAAFEGEIATMARAAANGLDVHCPVRPDRLDELYCTRLLQPTFSNDEDYQRYFQPINPKTLQIAVALGHHACVEWLLDHGGNIHDECEADDLDNIHQATNTPRCRLLFWAVRFNRPHMVQLLLARGVGLLLSSQVPKFKPIHLAAALGYSDLFGILLADDCTVDDTDSYGYTPLHYAAFGIHKLNRGFSPLTKETGQISLPAIQGLLRRGANKTLVSHRGETALELSIPLESQDWEAPLLLLSAERLGFVPSDRLIAMAIVRSEENGCGKMFLRRLLVGRPVSCLYSVKSLQMKLGWGGPPVPPYDKTSLLLWTIFEYSRIRGPEDAFHEGGEVYYELPALLISIGATPHLADSRGRTPLHACIFVALEDDAYESDEISQVLDKRINHRDRPFPFSVIAALLHGRGSLDIPDDQGHTPLDYAVDAMNKHESEGEHSSSHSELPSYAERVTWFTLNAAYEFGMCPSDAVKTRVVARFGRGVLHPEDELAAKE